MHVTVVRPYVRVIAKDAETVRRRLAGLGLIDSECKVQKDETTVYFPLHRFPNDEELAQIGSDMVIETSTREFQPLRSGPKDLAEALRGVLEPEEIELLPRAYDLVGDIAVLEIPDELFKHRFLIGRAFHRLHPNFATVLCKRGAVTGLTRVRNYEVLSGEPKTDTIHTEYGCRIAVDLAKAYFSPRLLEEHHRVALLVRDGEKVLDMFTGVGPFALHIARLHTAEVIAVDINPHAIDLLKKSIQLNRLRGTIRPVVADAHEYVPTAFDHDVDCVIMNHPSGASEFVEDACTAVRPGGVIHYYDFIGGQNPEDELVSKAHRLVRNAGRAIKEVSSIRRVRDSAPHEYQMVLDAVIE